LDFYEKKEKLEKVVKGYRWLVKEFANEFITINGERNISKINDDIIKYLNYAKN